LHRDDVVRRFWALFLGVEVTKAKDVPGYDAAWSHMDYRERRMVQLAAERAAYKINREGRDAEDAIAEGVARVKTDLRSLEPESCLFDGPPETAQRILGQWEANAVKWDAEMAAENKTSPMAGLLSDLVRGKMSLLAGIYGR
jgi:hypothetical protein